MKKRDLLINMSLICLVWFSLAFACKNSDSRRDDMQKTQKQTTGTDRKRPVQSTAGIGKPYGARDPQACEDLTGSSPNERLAEESFACHAEGVFGSSIYLVEEVSVKVGRGRPYNSSQDAMDMPNIDATINVYPIRGSFKQYQCSQASEYMQNIGKNCTLSAQPDADGLCYKTEWGDWVCKMADANSKTIEKGIAPPQ